MAQVTLFAYRKRHCRLIVRNLSFQANEANLADKFGKYGPLTEVIIPKVAIEIKTNKRRRRKKLNEHALDGDGDGDGDGDEKSSASVLKPRGFAFLTYLCSCDAQKAVQATAEAIENNKAIRVCNREVASGLLPKQGPF